MGKCFLKSERTYLVKTGCCSKEKRNNVIKILTITLQKQNKNYFFFLVQAHFQKQSIGIGYDNIYTQMVKIFKSGI